jgi:uncharacterized iron-regulated protein
MKVILVMFFANMALTVVYGQKQAYNLYNSKGKKVTYEKMLSVLEKKDIVLFGELHDNPISHWLEYELAADLNNARELILGAEMIEADNQIELDNYLKDSISFETFDSLARLWNNYKTDYSPLVELAKEKKRSFIATNVPRRYANSVYKQGFAVLDSLSNVEKEWIAPLPIKFDSDLPTYKKILEMMGDHGTLQLVMAQAVKDATMAFFILKNYKEGELFLHFNGAFHSDEYEGILWYLKNERPDLEYGTISTVSQDDVNQLLKENRAKADFIIVVDSNMTSTY